MNKRRVELKIVVETDRSLQGAQDIKGVELVIHGNSGAMRFSTGNHIDEDKQGTIISVRATKLVPKDPAP